MTAEYTALDFSEERIADPNLRAKYRALKARLRGLESVLIGFSGGVDSTLLTAVARHVLGRRNAVACLAVGPSLPAQEHEEALRLARLMDVDLRSYQATEFENPEYVANGPDRCFHCKTDLFRHLARFAATWPTGPESGPDGRIGGDAMPEAAKPALLYGGNLDDTLDFRPGRRAAMEHGALAPLAEAALSKAEVRALSRAIGLPTAEKPAQPCLSSRIPYGSPVTREKLAVVEAGEALLRELGFREFRLRHAGVTARVEVPRDQIDRLSDPAVSDRLLASLRALGFRNMEVDPKGFRSGSLNDALPEDIKSKHAPLV